LPTGSRKAQTSPVRPVLAAIRAARGDVLIDAHLTLQLARDVLVIAVLLRDRDAGLPTNVGLAERTRGGVGSGN
jgi:hypothetical protein